MPPQKLFTSTIQSQLSDECKGVYEYFDSDVLPEKPKFMTRTNCYCHFTTITTQINRHFTTIYK